MSGAAVRHGQAPVHPSGIPSSWVRCGQRPPQVRSPALGQHVLFLQWVWLVLWSSACLQGRRETTSTLPGGLFFCTGVQALGNQMIGGQGRLLLQGVRTTCSSKNKVASLEQQSASKAGECSFSLKLTIFPKLYDYI